MSSSEIESHYLGNENDEAAEVMKFKKSEGEILTVVHNHILSLSVIFFLLSLILATTSINKKFKYFLMIEPFLSIILTFGGIYFLWSGITWFKYVVIFSGMLMTFSFVSATIAIAYQILFFKKAINSAI
jgi:predicted tellurium resistance membrane protein TerC